MSGLVIVGGGLAGAAAAARLAQGGERPLLLERSAGAHDKICGEFLSTEAQAHLSAIGFDLARLGGAPIDRLRLVAGTRCIATRLPFRGLGVTRRVLDEALLDHAVAAGATVERGVAVRQIDGTTLETGAGTIDAGRLLLATGKHDVRGAKRDTTGTIDGLIGFKQYFRVSGRTAAALQHHIDVVLFDGGYAGLQLVEGGIANLCLLVSRERYAAAGDWPALLAELLREPHLRARLGDAQPMLDRPLTISGVPYGFVHRGDDALYRLGDQAGVIPSFSGDGMSIALHSAAVAARAVLEGADAAAYHRRLRADIAAQIGRATWLQRLGWSRAGRAVLLAGLTLAPSSMARAAAWTRVSAPALARAGVA